MRSLLLAVVALLLPSTAMAQHVGPGRSGAPNTTQTLSVVHPVPAISQDANFFIINDNVAAASAAPLVSMNIITNITGTGSINTTGHNVGLEVQVNNHILVDALQIGIETQNTNDVGAITNSYGFLSKYNSNAGTVTNLYGYNTLFAQNTGTISNMVDYYSPVYTGGGTVTNKYSFWGADTTKTFENDGPTALKQGLTVSGGGLNVAGNTNNMVFAPAATTVAPTLTAFGGDTNIGINIVTKGTGAVTASAPLVSTKYVQSHLYSVASLNTNWPCTGAIEPAFAGVNDALSPTAGATLVGGGAVHVLAYCNGSNWISIL